MHAAVAVGVGSEEVVYILDHHYSRNLYTRRLGVESSQAKTTHDYTQWTYRPSMGLRHLRVSARVYGLQSHIMSKQHDTGA